MSHSIPSEAFKELLFGGAFGLCSGFAVKKLSLPFIAGTVYRILDSNVLSHCLDLDRNDQKTRRNF